MTREYNKTDICIFDKQHFIGLDSAPCCIAPVLRNVLVERRGRNELYWNILLAKLLLNIYGVSHCSFYTILVIWFI